MTAAEKRKFIWREYVRASPDSTLSRIVEGVIGKNCLFVYVTDAQVDRIYVAYLTAKLKG